MKKWTYRLALGVLLLPLNTLALGLGGIQVNSTLNQGLDARIDLISAAPEDAEILIVKLASREAFIKAGLDRPHELGSLRFKTLLENDRAYISVTSPKPIREPSLSFLLEIDWPKGHLLRQYTVLLDPPGSIKKKGIQKPAPVSARPAVRDLTGAAN